uniref:Uncharacterized protein n=1 Tax=Anguilla anguilla TaxID=7936 RepID=A0A0E9SCC7_ANGAN
MRERGSTRKIQCMSLQGTFAGKGHIENSAQLSRWNDAFPTPA